MKRDNFDKFYEGLERLESEYPKTFNVIGHALIITSFIGVIIAFYYALTH